MTPSQSETRNPFRPGMGLNPPYLAGRQRELDRFRAYLRGFPQLPRNIRLTGLRGVGKTVLLDHYAKIALEECWLVVQRECSEHLLEEQAFALAMVENCSRVAGRLEGNRLRHDVAGVLQQTLELLGSLSVSLAGVRLTLQHPASARAASRGCDEELFRGLQAMDRVIRAAGRGGLVLCFDEAQVLRDTPGAGSHPLSSLLMAVARAQRAGLPVLLVLCGLPPVVENLARARSYSERMFQAEVLDRLEPPEDRLAFTRPLEAAGRAFEDRLVNVVVSESAGYPYFLQYLGGLLWESAPADRHLNLDLYEQIRPGPLAGLDRSFFDARLSRIGPFERRLLAAVAADGQEARHRDVVRRLGVSNGAVQAAVMRLVERGLLYRPSRGRIAFAVPLFDQYLRRKLGSA